MLLLLDQSNSKIFSTISTISFDVWISFSCSLIVLIKSLNALLIKRTRILFLSRLFFDFCNFSGNSHRSCTNKCFLTNSSFMSLTLKSISLASLLQSIRSFSFLIFFYSSLYLASSSSISSRSVGSISFLNPSIIFSLPL